MKRFVFLSLILIVVVFVAGCASTTGSNDLDISVQSIDSGKQWSALDNSGQESASDAPSTAFRSTVGDNQGIVTDDSGQIADTISDYLLEENGKQYLMLPISKAKLQIHSECMSSLDRIDVELLKIAEETIIDKTSNYSEPPYFYFEKDQTGALFLATELIVDIEPPKSITDEDGYVINSGCNIDHKHVFFKEIITK